MSDTNNPNNFEFPFQKKHINACSGVEELLPLWKLAHKCEVNTDYITGNVPGYAFLPDGIINEESFAKSSPRILFIAKEAYWYGEHDDDKAATKNAETVMFWHRRVAYGEVPETIFSKRLAMLANAIFNYDFKTINKDHTALRSVAVINLNKRGGFVGCVWKTLEEYVKRYAEFISQEIELISPELIVCCGDGVRWLLENYIRLDKQINVISLYHPSCWSISDKKYLQMLQKALAGNFVSDSETLSVIENAIESENKNLSADKDIIESENVELPATKNVIEKEDSARSTYMKMYGAGTTFQFNKKANVYYNTLAHSPQNYPYIALYTDKAVRAIGKVNAVIVTEFADNVLLYRAEQGEITDERKQTILEAIEDGKKYGYNLLRCPHKYFFVEHFFQTEYKKTSYGGARFVKVFDLNKLLGIDELPSTEEIANILAEKTWE